MIRRFGCSSEVATDALKRFGGHAGQAGLWLQEQRQQQDEQGQGQQQVTGEVLNPTATAVLQATAVPIAEATGDPEIASQDSAAAGYAPPPPPGASIVRVAFARACVAAIGLTPAVAIHSAKRPRLRLKYD